MRRQVVEDSVHHDRWLVSYADFITLLFAFFVVMYSISQVNESKYKVLSSTLTDAFNQVDVQAIQDLTIDPMQVGQPSKSNTINPIDLGAMALKNSEAESEGQGGGDETSDLPEQFKKISDHIDEVFGELLKTKMIHMKGNEEWLAVELNSSLLFNSGAARLNVEAMELLGEIASLVKDSTNPIRVEGFTDNIPISNEFFDSNWELSTSRAAAVVRLFVEEGVAPSRLAAIGYGEHQPLADNSTVEGRQKNRRVVLMISKVGALRPELPDVAVQSDFELEPEPELIKPPKPAELEVDSLKGVKTIELKGGGLLFTSEPENNEASQ